MRQTFCHIQGIGRDTERALWSQGCTDWASFLQDPDRFNIGSASRNLVLKELRKSEISLTERRHQYFRKALGASEAWRAWPEFRESCVYLDIETDGGQSGHSVTVVGLYDGKSFRCLIKDDDLGNLPDIISNFGMIVTFFGTGFDLPMLKRCFCGLEFDQIHLDLCPTLRQLGFKGGLKKIEQQLGIDRGDLSGMNGMDAVYLWRHYRRGDESALERLIAYNREDVVNLEALAQVAYDRLRLMTWGS